MTNREYMKTTIKSLKSSGLIRKIYGAGLLVASGIALYWSGRADTAHKFLSGMLEEGEKRQDPVLDEDIIES